MRVHQPPIHTMHTDTIRKLPVFISWHRWLNDYGKLFCFAVFITQYLYDFIDIDRHKPLNPTTYNDNSLCGDCTTCKFRWVKFYKYHRQQWFQPREKKSKKLRDSIHLMICLVITGAKCNYLAICVIVMYWKLINIRLSAPIAYQHCAQPARRSCCRVIPECGTVGQLFR